MALDSKKLAYWSEHYRSWQTSGLSQRGDCAQAGLSYASFDHWRRRARDVAGDAASSADKPESQQKVTQLPARLDNRMRPATYGQTHRRFGPGWPLFAIAVKTPTCRF
jgi:hypothetical protein